MDDDRVAGIDPERRRLRAFRSDVAVARLAVSVLRRAEEEGCFEDAGFAREFQRRFDQASRFRARTRVLRNGAHRKEAYKRGGLHSPSIPASAFFHHLSHAATFEVKSL